MKNYHSKFRTHTLLMALSLLLAVPFGANATVCAKGVKVTGISLGYVVENQMHGPDHGDALLIHFDNGKSLAADKSYNLDHSRGLAILSMLQMAMALRLPVDFHDHFGNRCDDFHHIEVYRDHN